jgi:hypothetical protein
VPGGGSGALYGIRVNTAAPGGAADVFHCQTGSTILVDGGLRLRNLQQYGGVRRAGGLSLGPGPCKNKSTRAVLKLQF